MSLLHYVVEQTNKGKTMSENRIICLKKRKSYDKQCDNISEYKILDVTSRNPNEKVAKDLSPLWLHGCMSSDGEACYRFENLWQYTKVYKEFTDEYGNPNEEYWKWRSDAFASTDKGVRFPFGRARRPEYAYWMIDGKWYKLGYLDARKIIYIPEYAKLVVKTEFYKQLKEYYDSNPEVKIALLDYDNYNNHHKEYNMSLVDVYNCHKKAGHAFVLKMLLQGDIEVVDGEVIDHIGVLKVDLPEPEEYRQLKLF